MNASNPSRSPMTAEENPHLLAEEEEEEEEEEENPHHQPPSPLSGDPPEDPDSSSACSTPYASAPSSPGRPPAGFYSAPASPIHHFLFSPSAASSPPTDVGASSPTGSFEFEFEFSSRLPDAAAADELFLNGQIRPTWPRTSPPHPDPDDRGRLRSRSVHRRARSMSPLRHVAPPWHKDADDTKPDEEERETAKEPCISASSSQSSSSSSRSSSSQRGSRKWVFLKELLLHRSKSEGRSGSTNTCSSSRNGRERFWHNLSFSSTSSLTSASSSSSAKRDPQRKKRVQGGGKRKVGASAHERHYAEKRAEAEEMRRRTFLPYRQGLFGCLIFSSKGYGALSGLARTLHTVSYR